MIRYFLDTNILIDFLGDRKPFSKYALKIFNKGRLKKWELWTSDNSITTAWYILEKGLGKQVAREKIGLLLKNIKIQPVTREVLQSALISGFADFEDGVQHFCALSHGAIGGIITRNQKDFKTSQITVFSPEELFEN